MGLGATKKTFDLLDNIVTVLGSTRTFFWPFLESTGILVQSYKNEDEPILPSVAGGTKALDDAATGFEPYLHVGGVYSYHFESGNDNCLIGADTANLSYFGGTDAAMSIGCWFQVDSGTGTLISKYNAGDTAREYKLDFAAGPDLRFFVYDETATAEEGVQTTTALSLRQWYFGVATYSGVGGNGGAVADGMIIYVDGAVVGDDDTDDGTYVDMEDLGGEVMIGATGDTAAPADEFTGRIALPFICGKLLSITDVSVLYKTGKVLLGV